MEQSAIAIWSIVASIVSVILGGLAITLHFLLSSEPSNCFGLNAISRNVSVPFDCPHRRLWSRT